MDLLIFAIIAIVLFLVSRSFRDYEVQTTNKNSQKTQSSETPLKREQKPRDEHKEKVEVGMVISMMASLVKADGKYCRLEKELIEFCFQDFSKPFSDSVEVQVILRQIFDDASTDKQSTLKIANDFYNQNKHEYTKRIKVLQHLINLAYIDKELHKDEEDMLEAISKEFKIREDDYKSIMEAFHKMYKNNSFDNEMDIEEAYQILQSKKDDSLTQVKAQYRALVKKYHPDLLRSKGFEDDYIADCTVKLQNINSAYECIKKHRK